MLFIIYNLEVKVTYEQARADSRYPVREEFLFFFPTI